LVDYIITPSVNGCAGTPFTLTVTVNPTAVITSSATDNWCNAVSNTYTATSSSSTATFAWTRASVAGITPLTGSGSSATITETLTNSTTEPILVDYIITPSVNGCAGTPFTLTVTVNPTAVITSSATDNWCNAVSNTYTATSSSSTATFAWTRASVAGITPLTGSGSSATITETLTNSTTEPILVDYIITPSVNGCAGTPFTLTVTVNPTAVITSSATDNWCNAVSNTYTATSSSSTATFAWTRASVAGITPLTGSGSSATITETLTNSTTEPILVDYIITPSVNGCAGTPFTLTVTVNPTAVITSSATDNWCNAVSNTYTATSSSSTATFAWTRASVAGITPLTGSGSSATITETLTNSTTEPILVDYIITPSVNGCAGTPFTLTVTVNPTAVITSSATDNWCNAVSNTYTATSSSSTATFAWTRASVAGITPLTGSGSSATITETLTNSTTEPILVDYIITPSVNGCAGTPFTLTVTVNPTAVITSSATDNWCNAVSNTYTATSSSSTATFAWTRASVAGITPLTGSGSSATITETLTNSTTEPILVDYIITPSVNGCAGTPFTLTVTVNPTAVITSSATDNWCNAVSNTYTATSSSSTATFAWTRASVAGITPLTGSGSSATITETLTNSTTEPILVDYIITPSVNGCAGTPFTLTVTVNPTAVITSSATDNWCNAVSNTYTATSSSSTATFAWTRASVAGITPLTGSGSSATITETLTNSTTEPILVDYIITPSVNGCAGTPFTLTVTVNPTAVITSSATDNWCNAVSNTYTATSSSSTATFAWTRASVAGITPLTGSGSSATITETLTNSTTEPILVDYIITPSVNGCAGTPFTLTVTVNPTAVITSSATDNWCNAVSNTYTATSSSSTATFAWTRASVAGITPLTGSGSSATITETLTNSTTEPILVDYIITPSVNGCAGTPFTLTVTVNPTAVITSSATDNWCNAVSNTYTATSSSSTATFAWTRASVAGITPLTGSGSSATITETLTNSTTEPILVDYIITPSVNGCAGTPFTLTVTVNPTAVITSSATANWCNAVSNTYTATSSSSTATFAWTRASVAGITPLTGSGSSATITETLTNSTTEPILVDYIITPSVNGCAGTPFTLTVTVNPTAVITSSATDNWCNAVSNTYTATSSSSTATFAWTRASVAGITPLTGSGSSATITETLTNSTTEPILVDYIITPSVNGCAGTPFTLTVTVNPTAVITSSATDNWCNAVSNTYTATSSSSTATFAWTRASVAGITPLTGSGSSATITETLTNSTTEPILVDYIITPSVNGCAGTPFTLTVTVNPTAVITSSATDNWCNAVSNTYTATSSSSTATFAWTRASVAGITPLTGSGSSATITETLTNSTDDPISVDYIITPSVNGCAGTPFTITVTVNPTPRIFPIPVNTIQCDSTTTNILLQSPSTFTSGLVTFKFTASATGGVTGFTPSATGLANGHVIADNLINPTDAPQIVSYVVTPVSPTGCNDGPSRTVTVTVNPTPRIFPIPVNTIQCDSTTTNIVLQSPSTFTSGLVTFKFTASATGGVTGFTPSATGLANGHVIADNLINPTDAPQIVSYVVTPVSPTGCNDGPSRTITVTVNPTPRIFPIPVNTIQCDSTTTNIVLQSPSTFTSGLVTFKFTASATGGVTGFTPSATGLANGHVIADNLINPTDAPQTVSYVVTPVSPTGCNDGPSRTVTVTVNPTPRIFPIPVNTIQCDSTTTNIVLQSPSTFTSGLVTFKFTASATGGVTGFTPSATGLANGHVIADNLINPTDAPQIVSYVVTPVSPTGCNDGPSRTITVTVNPTPRIFPIPVNTIQCDSTTTNIVLQSPSTFTSGLVTFKFTASATGGVTGFTPSATGLANGHVIADNLINPTDAPQTVSYVVTPVSPTGCNDGPSRTVTVTVNPTPRIFPIPVNTIQCDSTTTNIVLQSPSTFTSGLVTFKFTASATGGVTGFTPSATGLANGHVIADNLINPTDAPQIVSYVVTPVSPTGCNDGPSRTITVTVNPTPRIFPIPVNTIQCDSTTTNIVLQSPSTFTSGLVTFKFTASATGGVTGFTPSATGLANGHVIADNLINPTDAPQIVSYVVTPVSPTGCNDGPSRTITVTVNPTPRIFPIPVNTIQCDSTTTNIVLQSPSTFTSGLVTFKFTASATGGVTGFTPSATGLANGHVIADNLINPTDAPQIVSYVVTPVSPTGCNDGPSRTITVTVNPTPRIFPIPANTIQCDSTTTNIVLQSPSTFTSGLVTFKFTASATGGVTGFTPSATGLANGHIIADNLINPTDAPQIVSYVVTPVSPTGCNDGPSRTITVTVNPTPRIFPIPANTIQCDSTTTNIVLQSPSTFTSGLVTFKFTASATGGVTGFTPSATGLANGHIIADNLINPTDAPQIVSYVVTPVSPTGCNDGPSRTITVTVNPTPRIFPIPVNTIQCDSTTTNIVLQSPSTFTSGLVTFKFTASATGGVTGFTPSATGLANGHIIADNLINPTDAPQIVSYVVTPVSPTGCNDGPSRTITVTVNPTPRIFPIPVNTIQCDSTTTNILLQSPSTFTSGLVTFKFTASATGGVTGFTPSATGLANGHIIADNLINPTDAPQIVSYVVTPVSPTGCNDGPSRTITVTVNPTPRIFPIPANTIQCDSTTTNIVLQSPSTFTSGLVTFKFTASATGGVTGFTPSATGLANGHIIADNLINPTDAPQIVSYVVTPVSPTGCNDGPSRTITVTVNPTPRIFPIPVNTIQCDSTTTNIVLQSPSTFTSGLVTFKFTASATGGVTGFTPSATGLANGHIIADNLINPTDAPQIVSYVVTPVSPTGCNDGPSRTVTVTVNPTPRIFPIPVNTIQCDSTTTNILLQSPSTFTSGLVTFKFTASATGGVTGFTPSATGLANGHIIADNLINPTDAPQIVSYVVTPVSPTGCNDGPSRTITVTVNPTPRIFPIPANTIQCDSTTTNIVLQSPSTFTSGLVTFKFTASATGGVTGFTPSATGLANGHIIADNLINPTDAPQIVSYVVTPVSPTGCNDGPSRTITVTVNPTPRIFPIPVNTIQCDSTTTNIVLQSPSTFTSGLVTFKFTASATGGVTGFTPSATGLANGHVIADNLINPTDAPQIVSYVVTPVSPTGCNDGPSRTITVTVNPTPRIFPIPVNTIQCDSTTTNIVLQSPSTFTSGLVTFKFTASATGGVTGFTPSATGLANGHVIADNLINPTDAPQIVSYVVTPVSPTGCNDGPSRTVTVTVNPTPRIFPIPVNTIQCDSTTTNIVLQSPSTFTSGLVTFKFTASATGGVTGFTPSATGLANGHVIADNLINPTDAPQIVSYVVTPVSPTGCNDGPSRTITVTVNPTPRIFPIPVNTIQCDSTTTNIVLQSPSTFTSGLVTFKFTASATGGVTGFTPSATGLANGHVIADNLINPTDAPQTVSYVVTPVSPTGCNDGPSRTVTVTVNPTPRIFPIPVNTIQCDSTTTNIVLQSPSTFTSGLVTFKFTASATGGVTGFTPSATGLANGHVIADNLINPTDAPQIVSYVVTPVSPTGCNDGPSRTITVTVNPTPRIFPIPVNTIQCDSTTTNIVLQSPSTFTSGLVTFKFTASATGGVTGFTPSATGLANGHVIADNLINPTDAPQIVSYVVTPVSPTGCNDGPSRTITVTVNPTPRIFPIPVNTIQCDSTTTNIVLQSPSTFTSGLVTFKFTASATGGVTGFTPSATGLANGHVIADNLINPTDAPQIVSYVVTPVSPTGCNDGPSRTITVTVNPTPRIFPIPANTIQCDSTTTNIVLQSPSTFTSGLVTFKFTASATGGVTGFTPSATGLANGHIIADNLINPTDAPQIVSYVVTPVSPTGCNDGPSRTITVTVNPTPRIFPIPANTIQCDSTTTNIVLQSPSTFTSGLVTFKFTASATGGVTGFTPSATGLANGHIIADNLINPTDAPQIVSYVVTPVSPTGCNDGPSRTITVTVNPTPRIFPIPVNTIQCDSTTTNIVLQSPSTFTSGLVTFKFTASATGGVTGFTPSATGLANGHIIADNLINPTDAPQIVSYVVTPVSPTGCNDGPSRTITVTVNPTPRIFPIPANTIQCDSTTTNIVLQSPSTFTSGLVTFKFTASATGGVTGFTPSATGLANGHIIADNLINPTDAPQIVSYVVTPVSPTGCNDGPSRTVTVTVNPTPRIFPIPANTIQCDSTTTNIVLQSPSTFTSGLVTFKFTASATGGVTGFTPSATGLANGHIIADNLINPTDAPQIVSYVVTPVSPTGCNDGPSRTITVTVNPTPRIFPIPVNTIQCDSTTTNILLQSPSTFTSGLVTFKFTASATGGVTGFTPSATGLANGHVIADNLINPTDAPQIVSYVVTPVSPTGCNDGPSRTITVTVNPTPRIFPIPVNTIQCDSTTTNIVLQSPSTFTSGLVTFKFTASATGGVTGFTPSATGLANGHVIADNLINPTDAPQIVSYVVTPVSPTGCNDGPSRTITVTVNPTPRIFPIPVNTIQCDSTTTNIVLQSPSTFTSGLVTFKFTASATGGVTGFTPSATGLANGHVIADNLINPTDAPQIVSYVVTPVSPTGCNDGPSRTITVFINPTPRIIVTAIQDTLCNNGTSTFTVTTPTTLTGGNVFYNLVIEETSGGLSDISGYTSQSEVVIPGAGPVIFTQTFTNHTNLVQWVKFRLHPFNRNTGAPTDCDHGSARDTVILIVIEPTARVTGFISNDTICNDGTIVINWSTPTVPTRGIVFNTAVVNPYPEISGYTTAPNLPVSYITTNSLNNSGDTARMIMYVISPVLLDSFNNQKCPGVNDTIRVWVNPTPRAIPIVEATRICDSTFTSVLLTTPSVMTKGQILFDYTITLTGGPGDLVGNTNFDTGLMPGQRLQFRYSNRSDTVQSVHYLITPRNDILTCAPGLIADAEVKVHPVPIQDLLLTNPVLCQGGSDGALRVVLAKGTNPYDIRWRGPYGYTNSNIIEPTNLQEGTYWARVTDFLGCTDSLTYFIIRANENTNFTTLFKAGGASAYNTSCYGAADGEIELYITNGNSFPFDYWVTNDAGDTLYTGTMTENFSFANPASRRVFGGLVAGWYYIDLEDVNGCRTRYQQEIRSPEPIVNNLTAKAYAGGFNISCRSYNDGKAWVASSFGGNFGPRTFLWSTTRNFLPGTTTPGDTLRNLIAGTYYMRVTDFYGCTKVDSITLVQPDGIELLSTELSFSADSAFNVSCNGGANGSIDLNFGGGSGTYLYTWTGPAGANLIQGAEDQTNLIAGTYHILVTDLNGCVNNYSFTLTQPDSLKIAATPSATFDNLFNINCFGGTGAISLAVTGGSINNYTYNWTTSNGSGIVQGARDQSTLTAGTYTVVVIDSNSCVTESIINLTQPDPIVTSLVPVDITCEAPGFSNGSIDMTVTGGSGTYSYLWSNGETTKDVSGLTQGKYFVTVTDMYGCSTIDSAVINLPPPLTVNVVKSNYNGLSISCFGLADGSITVTPLTGEGPFTYLWTGPDGYTATAGNITALKAGTYTVTVTDANMCTVTEIIEMTQSGPIGMIVSLSASNDGMYNINCAGSSTGTINLTPVNAVGSLQWLWSDGATGTSRAGIPAGDYRVILTDQNLCSKDSVITITQPDSIRITLAIIHPQCLDNPNGEIAVIVTGGSPGTGYQFKWSDNSTDQNRDNLFPGKYKVLVTDFNGCTATDSVKLEALQEICLEIPNAFSPNGDGINDEWNIGMIYLYPEMEVSIFNRQGQLIWRSERGYPGAWNGRSNGRALPMDSYHYVINLPNGRKPIVGNVTIVR
jgi:gliding motility-associated-like protein